MSRYWKRQGRALPTGGKNGPGPRPCPASTGQSGPAVLTDGPAARSRGRPAPALRWGQMAREDRSWTSASVDPGRLPASHSRHSSGNRTRESPGSTADALSAVQTHFCLDSVPGAQRFLGPRASPACPGPGVLRTPHRAEPAAHLSGHLPDARPGAQDPNPA